MNTKEYAQFKNILEEELLPAMGCTEPIAVAYAAAYCRDVLGGKPEEVEISVSGNILKNVKGVVVPNTGGLKGVAAAAAAGIVAGVAEKKLEVIAGVTEDDLKEIVLYKQRTKFTVTHSDSGCIFDICVRGKRGKDNASVRIVGHHTNVVRVEKNGKVLREQAVESDAITAANSNQTDRSFLSVEKILEFAKTVEIEDIRGVITRQIEFNGAIANEGLTGNYGAQVGKTLIKAFGNGVNNVAKATAAAGSDARMNGCSMPVIIVSGSGNQGMTASLPVVVYAKHLKKSEEEMLRAVALSDLITIHLKTGIGRLSAYCGAVSAGCGAAAGICMLRGGGAKEISDTVFNAIAIDSGLICDGAKSSCAAKIASAVDAGLLGLEMALSGNCFCGGDGILADCVERTIDNVGDLARNGMRETDEEIIKIMIKD